MSDELTKAQQRIAELEHIVGGLKSNAKAVARAHANQVQALEEKNTRLQGELERARERLREVDPEWLAEGEAEACAKAQGYTGMACSCLCHEETGTCETCRKAASDKSALRQPPPAANRYEAPGGPIDVAAVEVAVRQPCPPSSVTGAACLLPPGHAADSSTRFHRYPPPPHDSASCPDCGGAAGPPREDR